MEPDDDIHYTLVALRVLEDHGPGFRWRDVASVWNRSLRFGDLHRRSAGDHELQQCGSEDGAV